MGFYGNITNTSKTQFQFDKIYSNRVEMERNLLKDNIYIGRYVLIEYDSDIQRDDILRVYTDDETIFYLDSSKNIILTESQIGLNELVYTYDDKNTYVYYQCESKQVSGSIEPAQFERVDINTNSNYTRNYHIDLSAYNSGRGYDSTVWQKVYTNNSEKYVMIAELNSVVPTFTVVADPPTMNPVAPHFDTESTDVYYKLHWQTPWGFRIAEAAEGGKSDGTTQWTTTTYDPSTGENKTQISADSIKAAIYFNKAAFDPQINVNVDKIKKKDTSTSNEIKVVPTSSGQKIYNDHNNPGDLIGADDIQEMTINLPAIGNMMSDAWDIIHGPRRNNDMREIDPETGDYVASLKGRLDSIDAIAGDEIPVKRNDNGQLIGSKVNGGKADKDDKTGVNDDAWIETIVDAATNTISIHHKFNCTKNGNTFIDLRKADDQGHDTTIDSINMNETADNFNIVTPIIDDMGHTVGKNTQTITLPYNFKTIKTNGVSADTNNPIVTENVDIVADNSKDDLTIAASNKWIRMANNSDNDTLTIGHEVHAFTTTSNGTTNLNEEDGAIDENNINIPDWDYDEAGHIKSKQDHYYTLPYGFKTFNVSEFSEEVEDLPATAGGVIADNTQDTLTMISTNKWIHLAADSENDTIKLAHEVNSIITTDKDPTNLNNSSSDSIDIPDWSYDEAGHIISKQKHEYILPYGYKEFRDSNIEIGQSIANNTQDVFVFKGDTWIKPIVSTDLATFTHIGPVSGTHTSKINNEPKFGETFTIEDHYFDDKGHKYSTETHTILLPKGSLNDDLTNGADVITQLTFTDTTGALSSTRTNISKLLLTGYEKKDDNSDIAEIDTLGSALSKLQTQVHDEETANTLLQESLEEEITRAKTAEAQALTDAKAYTDQIKKEILTGGSTDILGETYDTLLEISNWINGDGVNTTELTDAIAVESNRAKEAEANLETLITNEATNRENAIKASIESLDIEDFAIDGEYVSSVSQTDGKIKIERKSLPVYTLVESNTNGSINFNGTDIPIHGLGSVAYESVDSFVKIEDFNAAIAEKDQEIYTLNSRCNTLDTEVKNLINLVNDLTTRIAKLEEQNNIVE